MSATTISTVKAVYDEDDDGISFALPPGAACYDFGARLSMYRFAPEQFVPLSDAELQEMRDMAAEIDAEHAAFEEEEREQIEASGMGNCRCKWCGGILCSCNDAYGGSQYFGDYICSNCQADRDWADQLEEGWRMIRGY